MLQYIHSYQLDPDDMLFYLHSIDLPNNSGCGFLNYAFNGYHSKRVRISGKQQMDVTLWSTITEHASSVIIDQINSNYEDISVLVTGNAGDNETTDPCCSITLPPVDDKIRRRINPTNTNS